MKRLFYLMLVVLGTMAFVACSDDDENNGGNNNYEGDGSITMVAEGDIDYLYISTFKEGEITIDWGDGTIENFKGILNEDEEAGISYYDINAEHSYDDSKSEYTITIQGNGIIDYVSIDGQTMITSLDASECTTLTGLYCYGANLTSLNVSKNTALTDLDCSYNQLATLDVSGCTALDVLICYGNSLTTLDVSKCTALTYLNCNSLQLTSLNVSGCIALNEVYCDGNQLTTLDVSKCTTLTNLDCQDNNLTSLNISGCTALETLSCYDNQFTAAEMNKIYEALPTVEDGTLSCDQLGNPGIAEQKGWEVYFE